MRKSLLAICAFAMAMAASAQINYASVDPTAETVLPKVYGNYVSMAFTFNFDEAVTVKNVSAVKLYEVKDTGNSEVTPDDDWYATPSNGGKTILIWGSDYDGFTCSFLANDCDYELVIPAGTFTANGASNEEIRVRYYGQNAPVVPAEPLTYISVDPQEDTALGAETSYPGMSFTFTFDKAVTASADGVKLVKESPNGSEITPSDEWRVSMSGGNTKVQFWGADYDGYVDYFRVEDCDYYLIVPAGAIKSGDAENEEFVVHYFGTNIHTAINDVKDANNHVVARYNIQGQVIDANAKGIQLVKMSDGSTLKVIVK